MSRKSGRQAALAALRLIRRGGAFSQDAIAQSCAGLDEREASLCARLTYDVLQNGAYLDYYISLWSSTPASKMEPALLDILRISAAQILLMDRIPPRAAVSEGVNLCRENGLSRAAGLCNAVLRRIAENRDSLPPIPNEGSAEYLSVRYSHPLWLAQELIREHGYDFTRAFFEANNSPAPVTLQVNTLKTDVQSVRDALPCEALNGAFPDSLRLFDCGDVTKLPGFRDGLFYVQDDAARSAVVSSGVRAGMTVLDACAAPGGKSFAAGIQMRGAGEIISCDVQEKKISRIEDGAKRLGLSLIKTRTMDAREPPPELFSHADVVIADAPCSGLGVIRKKPEIRYKPLGELDRLPSLQLEILEGLAPCVKSGGTLLYSTCTVRRCENEAVAGEFLSRHPEFRAAETRTLWQHIDDMDGFFICRMVKSK